MICSESIHSSKAFKKLAHTHAAENISTEEAIVVLSISREVGFVVKFLSQVSNIGVRENVLV